ncbi:MAG TPA: anthranilate synthase component I family protein [Chitinophagaceae bacterium]|nr:anthranilate synthase component I family protein [Chitinophagaceae bacterium]
MAAGTVKALQVDGDQPWEQLRRFRTACADWIFGHFSYDLKEGASGENAGQPDGIGFPRLFFFQPEILILWQKDALRIGVAGAKGSAAAKVVFDQIRQRPADPLVPPSPELNWQTRMSRQQYLDAVRRLQQHLQRGDAYEINFCREFFAENVTLAPSALFERLNRLSPAPFAAYYRVGDRHLLCSSPERFLQKNGPVVISQPIKGTAPRGKNAREDELYKSALSASAKERSENVMAVDLVRNDLSRTALPGTVRVKELFGVYSFPQVHQLITTIEARVDPGVAPEEIISHAFPMGSMTGAPKHRVLQLIDAHERTRRGIYSGALGYFTPAGDFDFNVVIRSLAYHAANRYLSFQTGSGITIYSDPERELEECLLKGRAMQRAVQG